MLVWPPDMLWGILDAMFPWANTVFVRSSKTAIHALRLQPRLQRIAVNMILVVITNTVWGDG